MKTNSIGKSFTIDKILKIDFQNFDVSWNVSKSISWTFLGSLHDETIVKYVFHEMLWKKYFTVYPCLDRVAGQETQTQMFSCGVYEIFKNLRGTVSGTCSFTWGVLPNKLHFGSNWYMIFYIIVYSFACQFSLHY